MSRKCVWRSTCGSSGSRVRTAAGRQSEEEEEERMGREWYGGKTA